MSDVSQCGVCGTLKMMSYCPKCDHPTHLYTPQLQQAQPYSNPSYMKQGSSEHSPQNTTPNKNEILNSSPFPTHIMPISKGERKDTSKKALTLEELEKLYLENNKNRRGAVIAALQDEINNLKKERDDLSYEKDTLEKQNDELLQQLQAKNKQMLRSDNGILDMEESNGMGKDQQDLLAELRDEINDSKNQIASLEQRLKEANNGIIASKHQERIIKEIFEEGKQEIERLQKENNQLMENLKHLQQVLELATQAKEEAEQDTAETKEALKEAEDKNTDLQQQNQNTEKRAQELQEKYDDLMQAIKDYQENEINKKKHIEQIKDRNDKLLQENNAQEESLQELNKNNKRQEDEISKLKKENQELQGENDDLKKAKEELQGESDDLKKEKEELQGENESLKKETAVLYSDNVELKGGNESLKSALRKEDGERARLALELEKVKSELVGVLEELGDGKDCIVALQGEKKKVENELNNKILSLEKEITASKVMIADTERTVDAGKRSKLDAVLEVAKERERSAELAALCDKLSSECRSADDEIECVRHAVYDYEVRFDAVRPSSDLINKGMEREGYVVYPIVNKGRTTIGRSGMPLGVYR